MPKFRRHRLGRWVMGKMNDPNYRVKLDDFGTHVWLHCDGNHTVNDIAKALHEQFGEDVEPVLERLQLFIQKLQKGNFISLNEPTT
ncbi:MAG: PqqD family peptide modification chaperone [Calditrichae bacterium]|nr:PqqD family peptide modification chaperone [Calditrichia bacterium]